MSAQDQVTISIIGTGTPNGGGVAPTTSGTIATTPGTQPNLLINVILPSVAILVRFANMFLTTFMAGLTAAGVGGPQLFGASDLLGAMRVCAWVALIAAGLGLGKNLITVFGRLEGRYPLFTGSI